MLQKSLSKILKSEVTRKFFDITGRLSGNQGVYERILDVKKAKHSKLLSVVQSLISTID